MIRIKRVYEPASRADGFRILVDRLWPRGLTKQKARVDVWLKEVAPSHRLRKLYAHAPERWPDFKREYGKELRAKKNLLGQVKQAEKEHGRVTLLFAARNKERNNAVALMEVLRGRRKRK